VEPPRPTVKSTSPTPSRSWVDKVAKASMGIICMGEKNRRKEEQKLLSVEDTSSSDVLGPGQASFQAKAPQGPTQQAVAASQAAIGAAPNAQSHILAQSAGWIVPAVQRPHASAEEQREMVHRGRVEANRRLLIEYAKLCSQWPMSRYNMIKYGPHGVLALAVQ
jgi:hypothetical protein